jgi:hypothetical protein
LNNNDLPPIYAFPKGESSWRIDWFGDLAFPNRLIRRKQPSLLLHLSRVLDSNYRDNPSVLLSPASTTPAKFQRKIWVSIGTLPRLRIGDNGIYTLRPWVSARFSLSRSHVLLLNRLYRYKSHGRPTGIGAYRNLVKGSEISFFEKLN